MRYLLSLLITFLKKESFHLDKDIPISYLFFLCLNKFFSYIRFVLRMRTFKLGFMASNITLLNSKGIIFGKNLSISTGCYIDSLSRKGIVIGNNVSIGKCVHIECTGTLKDIGKGLIIQDNVGIGSHSFLGCAGGITIGNNTIIGNYVSFHSENHNFKEMDVLIRLQGVNRKGIDIGENCWIGAKVTILDGVVLGKGCIVAAGTVLIAKSYPDNSIIGGVPGKVIKSRFD